MWNWIRRHRPLAEVVALMLALCSCGVVSGEVAAADLRMVPATDKPRFVVTDRMWPERPGEADVCLWKGDHLAAVSITIDDNKAQDHDWWLEIGERYGVRFTWFVVTKWTDSGDSGFRGTWDHWIKLREAGHDIQSHSADHFSDRYGPILPAEENYRLAIEQIAANVPDTRVLTLAYPNGGGDPNDYGAAARQHIAARGTVGMLNSVDRVDYLKVNSLSGFFPMDPKHHAGLPNLIGDGSKKSLYRGWACFHFHGLKDHSKKKADLPGRITAALDYFTAEPGNFWIAPFTDVAQYAQERDTARVSAVLVDGAVRLDLTDGMDDSLFDEPLTIKVRLDDGWADVAAVQAGRELPVTMVDREGRRYALVDAVPDRGPVFVRPN